MADLPDNREIRRANLEGLLTQLTAGNMAEFERRYGIDASVLSQIKNGSRNMGDELARKVEAALDKEKGWMDHPQFRMSDVSIQQAEAAQIAEALDPSEREAWLKHGRLLVQSKAPAGTAANPFGDVARVPADARTTAGAVSEPRQARKSGKGSTQ